MIGAAEAEIKPLLCQFRSTHPEERLNAGVAYRIGADRLALRGFHPDLQKSLRDLAAREISSLNKAAFKRMRRGAGLDTSFSSETGTGRRATRGLLQWLWKTTPGLRTLDQHFGRGEGLDVRRWQDRIGYLKTPGIGTIVLRLQPDSIAPRFGFGLTNADALRGQGRRLAR